jgi:hypothetical protein
MTTSVFDTDERSIGDLVGEATSELSLLLRKEVELAKLELKQEAKDATESAKYLGVGAFCGYLAALLLSFAAAWALAEVVPIGVAFLIVAVLFGIAAAIALKVGRERLAHVHAVPEETVETLKEDVQWLTSRKNDR